MKFEGKEKALELLSVVKLHQLSETDDINEISELESDVHEVMMAYCRIANLLCAYRDGLRERQFRRDQKELPWD